MMKVKEEPLESFYGGVSDEDRKIPFFDKVDKYINKIQIETVNNGYIQTPKGRKYQ